MSVTRHLIVLGSTKEAFLQEQIAHRYPFYDDNVWASGCPCDLLTIRLGDMGDKDLPSVLKEAPSFAWGSNVFLDVLNHVRSVRHRTRAEMCGDGMVVTSLMGPERPHHVERDDSDSLWGRDLGLGLAAFLIVVLVVVLALIGLGVWKAMELMF